MDSDQTLVGAIEELSADMVRQREALDDLTKAVTKLTETMAATQQEIFDLTVQLRRASL